MSGDKEPFFWHSNPEWYRINSDGEYELTDKAPERAVSSFELAKKMSADNKSN